MGRGTGLTAAARGEFAREVEAAAPVFVAPVWNGLRRLWMVDGVAVAPQPAAPVTGTVIESVGTRLLPSVKVSA